MNSIYISDQGELFLIDAPEKPTINQKSEEGMFQWRRYEESLASAIKEGVKFKDKYHVCAVLNIPAEGLIGQTFPLPENVRVSFEYRYMGQSCFDGETYQETPMSLVGKLAILSVEPAASQHVPSDGVIQTPFCVTKASEVQQGGKQERILCAAIWYDDGKQYCMQPINIKSGIVVSGHRHPHCKVILMSWLYPNWQTDTLQEQIKNQVNNKEVQGFLTSTNRFLTREEACKLWIEQGHKPQFQTDTLFSEDLY